MLESKASRTAISATIGVTVITLSSWKLYRSWRRRQRSKWVESEEAKDKIIADTVPSIIEHFHTLFLDTDSTIGGANIKRSSEYYQRARDAHLYDLCRGVRSYPRLRNRREEEMKRIMHYYTAGRKSHRTVLVMCDDYTSNILDKARDEILSHLDYSCDIATTGVWIPKENIIPREDLHVTVALPWWWHTMEEENQKLNRDLVGRFHQALVSEFHYAFQIELERIVLLGGKTLVALWRCIGQRKMPDGSTIYDRHGDDIDPFVKLRRDIVRCFTTNDFGEPLTYTDRKTRMALSRNEDPVMSDCNSPPPMPKPGKIERANTIEMKTPGLGNKDGFIHTTLVRLPLKSLSMKDVELAPIHRLCREATATYSGHRMVVSKFRFLETTGAGGESNPCVKPTFDETLDALPRVEITSCGFISENVDLHVAHQMAERSATIGALPSAAFRGSVDDLFHMSS